MIPPVERQPKKKPANPPKKRKQVQKQPRGAAKKKKQVDPNVDSSDSDDDTETSDAQVINENEPAENDATDLTNPAEKENEEVYTSSGTILEIPRTSGDNLDVSLLVPPSSHNWNATSVRIPITASAPVAPVAPMVESNANIIIRQQAEEISILRGQIQEMKAVVDMFKHLLPAPPPPPINPIQAAFDALQTINEES